MLMPWFLTLFLIIVTLTGASRNPDLPRRVDVIRQFNHLSLSLEELEAEVSAIVKKNEKVMDEGIIFDSYNRKIAHIKTLLRVLQNHRDETNNTEVYALVQEKMDELEKSRDSSYVEQYESTREWHSFHVSSFEETIDSINAKLDNLWNGFAKIYEYTNDDVVLTNVKEQIVNIKSVKLKLNQEIASIKNRLHSIQYEKPKAWNTLMSYWSINLPNKKNDTNLDLENEIQRLSEENKAIFDEMSKEIEEYQNELEKNIKEILEKASELDIPSKFNRLSENLDELKSKASATLKKQRKKQKLTDKVMSNSRRGLVFMTSLPNFLSTLKKKINNTEVHALIKQKETELFESRRPSPEEIEDLNLLSQMNKEFNFENKVASINARFGLLRKEFETLQELTKDQELITRAKERIVDVDSYKQSFAKKLANTKNGYNMEKQQVYNILMSYWGIKMDDVGRANTFLETYLPNMNKEQKLIFEEIRKHIEEYQKETNKAINLILSKSSLQGNSTNKKDNEVEGSGEF